MDVCSELKPSVWLPGSTYSHCPGCFQQRELDSEEPEQAGCRRKFLLKTPFLMHWQIHDSQHLGSSFASVDCDDDDWHEILEL
jgi:hypothetical protein